jgi:hypothetical protein
MDEGESERSKREGVKSYRICLMNKKKILEKQTVKFVKIH